MDNATKCTEEFLRAISKHLSGRSCCRQMEYVVSIQSGKVTMEPKIDVYKNRYSRRETDKVNVIDHVLYSHISCKAAELVPGTYKYMLSNSGKRRKWTSVI